MPTTDSERRPNNAYRVRGSQEMLQQYSLMQHALHVTKSQEAQQIRGETEKAKRHSPKVVRVLKRLERSWKGSTDVGEIAGSFSP
jgi:hypothetical protein